jgi:hypothetical protein
MHGGALFHFGDLGERHAYLPAQVPGGKLDLSVQPNCYEEYAGVELAIMTLKQPAELLP